MCGIIGYIFKKSTYDGSKNIVNYLLHSTKIFKNRGLSGCGISINRTCYHFDLVNELESFIQHNLEKEIGEQNNDCVVIYVHFLHAIEGRVLQPILNDMHNSALVFNGEIYNYKELNKQLSITTKNDSQFLMKYLNSFEPRALKEKFNSIIDSLDADFAFVYQRDQNLFLCRDYLGVKPLWYEYNKNKECFMFSSERKVLTDRSREIKPNRYYVFNIETQEFEFKERILKYRIHQNENVSDNKYDVSYNKAKEQVYTKLISAVKKRLPSQKDKKIGLLFSGGVDSTVLALLLKQCNIDFVCYNAEFQSKSLKRAEDSIYSEEIAQIHNLNLKVANISDFNELEELIIEAMNIIESCDYIKVSVALPFLVACKKAREDGIEIMFSGLGSEEIFAGYRRHRQVEDINEECLRGLHLLHTRDLYRDDVISMSKTQELRVPFLDIDLINYSLPLPPKFKIDIKTLNSIKGDVYKKPHLNSLVRSKIILRDVAIEYLYLEERFANRQKKAAQYGSKFDKAILRLAKDKNLSKQEYLNYLVRENNIVVFD